MNNLYQKFINVSNHINQKDFQNLVKSLIENSKKILDVGCGIGDYLVYTNSSQDVTAVEPHLPYIEKAKQRAEWVKFINEEAISFFEKNNELYDLILMIDVVEHLNEEDGFRLIEEAKKHCDGILFVQIPTGEHPQNNDIWNLNGEYWQTHRTTWDEDKLIKANFSFYQIWEDWYQWEHKDKSLAIAFWSKAPLVSIVVPSYNQAEWLPKTLDSIISQTYPVWEAIIVNDGSTDNTKEVIDRYLFIDKRFKAYHKENGGISSALNYGIDKAKGQYFCWLSSDDLFNPIKLELQVNAYNNLDESYGLVFGAFDLVDANDNIKELEIKKPFIDGLEFPQQLKYDIVDGCTVMIPMSIMREFGGFNTQYKHAQDTEFWFRLAAKGYKFYYLNDKLTKRRIHENQGFTDFNLDCRYDGYYFVDFYLSNYSFREFYKNLDFNNNEDENKFILHFFDMISDPNCHINHPSVNDKFLKWFEEGLKTLDIKLRDRIISTLYDLFNLKQEKNFNDRSYLIFLKNLFEKIKNLKPQNFTLREEFADITKYDRTSEDKFSTKLLNFGFNEITNKRYDFALSVFKYLSDFPNVHYEEAIKKFYELVLQLDEHLKFIRSFRRKSHITTFPDVIKFYYWFSKIKLNQKDDELNLIYNSITDLSIKEKIDSIIQEKLEILPYQKIIYLNYEVIPYDVHYLIEYECIKCKKSIKTKFKSDFITAPNKELLLCNNCLNVLEFDENVILKYFESKSQKKLNKALQIKNRKPKIVFIMRYTNIIGGGVKIAYNYMQLLNNLGCEIIVYSNAEEPTWIKLPGKFIKVRDHYDIKKIDADVVVVFSIYDVPKMLMKFDPERIYHLCQGYEGYHIGRNFEELRADKFFYTSLHSLPVKNILVSKHLIDFFKNKWNREGFYIPNGIDLNVFKPNPSKIKKINSILFVGNPLDKLKGFNFLLEALDKLQNSENRFNELNLYVVWGGNKIDGVNIEKEIKNVKIHIHSGLTSDMMANLFNEVMLLVSTSWYEGFTLPALEAMACGVPTIVTKNMGAESFCKHNINSFLVEYGDFDSLNKYIVNVLRGNIDLINIIKNGFETVIEYSSLNSTLVFIKTWETILNYKFEEDRVNELLISFSFEKNYLEKLQNEYLEKVSKVYTQSKPLLSIIIPVYNQINYTIECIQSLSKFLTHKAELIIIDNASSDNTSEMLSAYKNENIELNIIKNEINLGFPKAVNQGIINSSGKYILITNNDIVFTRNSINRMIEIAESNPQIGIVGPISNEVSGLQKDNNAKYKSIEEMHNYAKEVCEKNKGQVLQFPRVAFLCTLIKREVIEKIGGLDERFSPGNYEDDDFCLRAQIVGYKTVIVKDAFIHHYGSKSFKANGEKAYAERLKKNEKIFVEKWGATPDEIWLQNKSIKPHQFIYPINKNEFLQHFNRLRVHLADSELELAKIEIENAIESYSGGDAVTISKEDLLEMAGNLFLAGNDLEKAQYYLEQELQLSPTSSNACLGLGKIFYLKNELEAAKTMFEWALKNNPNNEQAQLAYNEIMTILQND